MQDWVTHLVLGRVNPGDAVLPGPHPGQVATFVRVERMPDWSEDVWDEGKIVLRWSSGQEVSLRPSVCGCWITEPPH